MPATQYVSIFRLVASMISARGLDLTHLECLHKTSRPDLKSAGAILSPALGRIKKDGLHVVGRTPRL